MTKAKKWKIAIISVLGLVAVVLIAIGEGRFWKYQENYIPDGTYQMVKYEAKSAYSNELINWTERGEHIDKISKKGEEYSRVKEVSVQRCVDDYKKMLKQKRTYEKRPNGLVLTVYADDGHIESRRTFKRLSSEEARGVKSGYDGDYEYALESYQYRNHYGDYAIWR